MTARPLCFPAFALLLFAGCNTIPIPAPYVGVYPSNLSAPEALVAVTQAIEERNPGPATPVPATTQPAQWQLLSINADYALCQYVYKGKHILRARIEFLPNRFQVVVDSSINLKQEAGMIHRETAVWLEELLTLADFALTHASQLKRSLSGPDAGLGPRA